MKNTKFFIGILSFVFCFAVAVGITSKAVASADQPPLTEANWLETAPEEKPLADGEFTLIAIGDTQWVVEYAPEHLDASMEWIVKNKDALNIKYVMSAGDVVDDVDSEDQVDGSGNLKPNVGSTWQAQLTAASNSYGILNKGNVPFVMTLGNHDYEDMAFDERRMDAFNEYFPLSTYDGWTTYGGSMNDTLENTYHYFENGDDKYMIIALGHHPNDEILAWANKVVSENKDRKVIVLNHGYITGQGYGNRTPFGENTWNKFISLHENIFMVCCGHELQNESRRVHRSVAYGVHGNSVQQILQNPAEIEGTNGGGHGLLTIMKFRNDGTVDLSYYSPAYDKYYGAHNQYNFELNERLPEYQEVTPAGTTHSGTLIEDFTQYSLGNDNYLKSAYASKGVALTARGVEAVEEGAYITYKFVAETKKMFNDLVVGFEYASLHNGRGISIEISEDGVNYVATRSFDAVCQTAQMKGATYQISANHVESVYGNKNIYVRLGFMQGSVGNVAISGLNLTLSDYFVCTDNGGGFEWSKNFADVSDWDITKWCEGLVYTHNMVVYQGYLGTGRQGDYAGARGTAIWQFDAPEGATIETLNFAGIGRAINSVKFDYAIKIEISTDGGKTYTDCATEKESNKRSFSYDLSSYAKGEGSIIVKLILWGDYWHTTGFSSIDISGTYKYAVNYVVGDGENSTDNVSSYVTGAPVALKDAVAPEYFTFGGWYDNAELVGNAYASIPAEAYGNLTLYAKYNPIAYNVIYNLGGGKNNPENTAEYYSYCGKTLAPASRTGYVFAGWYSNADFSGERVDEIDAGTTGDVEVYAKFLKNYRITYVLGGGVLENKIETFTQEDEITFAVPTKEGYTFDGWYTDSAYTNKIERIERGTSSAVTVYAKWTKTENIGGDASDKKGCNGAVSMAAPLFAAIVLAFALRRKKSYEK